MPRASAPARPSAPSSARPAPTRRGVLAGLAAGLSAGLVGTMLPATGFAAAALAQATTVPGIRYFRIGTGTTSGTYFPLGGLIANAISNPPGSRPCERGGSCGIPGLVAVAQATLGSVENVALLRSGGVEAAMVQADVAYGAYTGSGSFEGKPPFEGLRSIGMLYAEAIQIVVRADGDLHRVEDLRGQRVSLGEEGSGVLVESRAVLAAYGLGEKDLTALHFKPGTSGDRLAKGEIDAFFMVSGVPVAAVADVANRVPIRLIPLEGEPADALRARQRFYIPQVIAADTYAGISAVPTLSVGAELVTTAALDADLVYGITKTLWLESTRRLLVQAYPKAGSFEPSRAVANVSVPLHPGAERYYREAGLVGNAANEADSEAPAPAAPSPAAPSPVAPSPAAETPPVSPATAKP